MNRSMKWRTAVVLAALVVALIYVYPSVAPSLPTLWQKVLPTDKIHLGLDLKGGMHLILEVQAEKAVESSVDRTVDELKHSLRKARIPANLVSRTEGDRIELQLARAEDLDKVNKLLDDDFGFLVTQGTREEAGRLTISLSPHTKEAKRIKDQFL